MIKMAIINSTFSENRVNVSDKIAYSGYGSGIFFDSQVKTSTLELINSITFFNNTA